jgi:hypothetical protein
MQAIRIDTFRSLLENNHGLDCWCPACRRWASCDLPALINSGLGDAPFAAHTPRCRKCGSAGRWQVRAPVPQFAGLEQYGVQ